MEKALRCMAHPEKAMELHLSVGKDPHLDTGRAQESNWALSMEE